MERIELTKEPEVTPEQGLEPTKELDKQLEKAPEREPESERIAEIADQLKAIESLVSQGFVGIEANVKALQDRITQTSLPPPPPPPPS